jgi:hypothetical protein
MKRSNRRLWLGAIALAVLVVLSLFAAPNSNKISTGSTYNRAPDGYGAWYAYMQERGTNIQRWQKPFDNLPKTPTTFLRINSYLSEPFILPEEKKWVENGNKLVVLGVNDRVTAADFTTMQESPVGEVKIETRRRRELKTEQLALGDRFGAIVWQQKYGKGTAIYSITPYLAANAYQDNENNFKYLADLVNDKKNNNIFVDEYIHGYKDADVREKEGEGNLLNFFIKKPLFVAFVQIAVLLLILIWALNQRFGKPVALETIELDNSEAYIQALAQVLQKADKNDFVMEMVAKDEQIQLQKALGLGQTPLEREAIVNAWVRKTGNPATELDTVLRLQAKKSHISERDLVNWLGKMQNVRRGLG